MKRSKPSSKTNKYAALGLSGIIVASGLFIVTNLFSVHITNIQAAVASSCANSSLWSTSTGIKSDRLTDFSRAGYMAGDASVPNTAAASNTQYDVTDSKYAGGAVPNDGQDDTAAFKSAIAAASAGAAAATDDALHVVKIPNGAYRISEPLRILTNNVVLSGGGMNKTILKFPLSLNEYCDLGNNMTTDQTCVDEAKVKNPFSQDRGFIQLGDDTSNMLRGNEKIAVTQDAQRGDYTLHIDTNPGFEVNQWVVLEMLGNGDGDPQLENGLMRYLQGGALSPNIIPDGNVTNDREIVRSLNKIKSIDDGSGDVTLNFALPLNTDVLGAWEPTISSLETNVSNVGIENLRILFPFTEYKGHTVAAGYNAIHFSSASNCWASNIAIHNADNALKLTRSAFCTIKGIKLNDSFQFSGGDKEARKDLVADIKKRIKNEEPKLPINEVPKEWLDRRVIRGAYSGHHGIHLGKSYFILVKNSHAYNRPSLFTTVASYANMNVFSDLSGFDATLDHHRRAPHNNLYSEIDTGLGTHVWKSGGGLNLGTHAGIYNTYWGITRDNGEPVLPVYSNVFDQTGEGEKGDTEEQEFGFKLNFVFNVDNASRKIAKEKRDGWLIEDRRKNLCTPNLYEAMKEYSDQNRDDKPVNIF